MASAVNAGARLDRLPISPFPLPGFSGWSVPGHVFRPATISIIAGGVIASVIQTKFALPPQIPQFRLADLRRHDHRRVDQPALSATRWGGASPIRSIC